MRVGVNGAGQRRFVWVAALLLCAALPHAVHAQAPPPGVFFEVQTAIAPRISQALEPMGFEPTTFALRTRRSPN